MSTYTYSKPTLCPAYYPLNRAENKLTITLCCFHCRSNSIACQNPIHMPSWSANPAHGPEDSALYFLLLLCGILPWNRGVTCFIPRTLSFPHDPVTGLLNHKALCSCLILTF